jgi:serine/threonine-protein phosphatase 2A activator
MYGLYLLTVFGSFVRMDYGTGHFLLFLTLIQFLSFNSEEARDTVLTVFVVYLRLCWRPQDVYRSRQVVTACGETTRTFLDTSLEVRSFEVRLRMKASCPDDVLVFVDQSEVLFSAILHPSLPPTNLSIMRIHEVKRGSFQEHSSQLYSIATGVTNLEEGQL